MPKHGLETNARQKLYGSPEIGGVSPASTVVLSNEILLRSKIAQLEAKKAHFLSNGTDGHSASHAAGQHPPGVVHVKSHPNKPSRGVWKATSTGDLCREDNASSACSTSKQETDDDILDRFRAQVSLARRNPLIDQRVDMPEEQEQYRGFTAAEAETMRQMYLEQIRGATTMSKQVEVVSKKIQELRRSNQMMRTETDRCFQDKARLEPATSKLRALSVELDRRRKELLETRSAAASDAAQKREEMNASLNVIVADISAKIKEQEKERIAQDKENAALRRELQSHLQEYDENKKASVSALEEQERQQSRIEERLAKLMMASNESMSTEAELRSEIEAVLANEQDVHNLTAKHSERLKLLEAALDDFADTIGRARGQATKLDPIVTRLARRRSDVMKKGGNELRSVVEGSAKDDIDGIADKVSSFTGGCGEGVKELEREKHRLQVECRRLQTERKSTWEQLEARKADAVEAERKEDENVAPLDQPPSTVVIPKVTSDRSITPEAVD